MKDELLGMLVTAVSILAAAVVSGLRLKPYIDAGLKYTPASFMIYPALIAALLVFPTVIALRRWQGSKDVIHIGPLAFRDRTSFMALWCLLYILVAVAFFPYREPAAPLTPVPAEHATSYTHPSHAGPADNPYDIT